MAESCAKLAGMTRTHISSGSSFEAQIGYSRAVVDGRWIFVSGTTGFDYSTMKPARGVVEQTRLALANIQAALAQADSSLDDVVRVTYIVPTAKDFEACWPLLREAFAVARPAATMISAKLLDPRMKIEIEVTARRQTPARAGAKLASKLAAKPEVSREAKAS